MYPSAEQRPVRNKNEGISQESSGRDKNGGDKARLPGGISPYATGGGGVSFERKVAAKYLAHLLIGDGATELGDGRCVASVAFQQSPSHAVDDLVVAAARPEERQPSLILALAVRRSPKIAISDESTRKLVCQFVGAVIDSPPDGPDYRFGLVVAGPQTHAEQLAILADTALVQMDAQGFFELVRTPGKFRSVVRSRLDQLELLVSHSLHDLDVAEAGTELVQEFTWRLLSRLKVLMPRLESPDDGDWADVANGLRSVVRDCDIAVATQLRDRLVALAGDYSPRAACVDSSVVRRDSHALLDSTKRRHRRGWRTLKSIHWQACAAVRAEIVSSDGTRRVRLDRSSAAGELVEQASQADAVVISGDSGVGKSALAVLELTAAAEAEPHRLEVLCINLRHLPKLVIELEHRLGHPLPILLSELSAPQRLLVVDGADAMTEDKQDTFRHLVAAARQSGLKALVVTSVEGKRVVLDEIREQFGDRVAEYGVPLLRESEIAELVGTFSELTRLSENSRSRELLRRLVVVDLLVRGRVSSTPLTDADAMNEVWSGLVRRRELPDRGYPDARETALLRLAEVELFGRDRLEAISGIDSAALDGLRRDGLVENSTDAPFTIGPEFAHDEVRRYAIARFLLSSSMPASRLLREGAPRWSLAAARLACLAWLARPETPTAPLKGRFDALQESFDALVEKGHGARWGDVPGEALLQVVEFDGLLRDAWSGLLDKKRFGLRQLVRLINQRHRDDEGVMDVGAVEPIIALLLEDAAPWRFGTYIQDLFRRWLRTHVLAHTGAGHRLRILLRKRIVEACAAADRRLAEEQATLAAARAARTAEEIEEERQYLERYNAFLPAVEHGGSRRRQRAEVPLEVKDEVVLELLSLLGPDLGDDGEAILRRVAKEAPSWLAPAVDEFFTGQALANSRKGLLAELTAAYYIDDEFEFHALGIHQDGVRDHLPKGLNVPMTAWYRGPFMSLFQSDFSNGVRVLNRLLNHAARARAAMLARIRQRDRRIPADVVGAYEWELGINGTRKRFAGDDHVWRWYRQTGVGPYPCISGLRALERACDRLIEEGYPLKILVKALLDGCENVATVGLVVGILVRHMEVAEGLLDAYLGEPLIWEYEFARVVNEASPFVGDSDALVEAERRKWSFREVAMMLVARATDERASELAAIGSDLVANARRSLESACDLTTNGDISAPIEMIDRELASVRGWASSLDRERYSAYEAPDGVYLRATPPDDVVQALADSSKEIEIAGQANRLFVRYGIDQKERSLEDMDPEELAADLKIVRNILKNAPSRCPHDPWDLCGMVAAAVVESYVIMDADLPDRELSFAAEILLRIGEGGAGPRQFEVEGTFWEQGADRRAARSLPLLLLPEASKLRALVDEADGSTTLGRALGGGLNSANAVADEVRLYLGRGLDHVWESPCAEHGHCHHELGWQMVTEIVRHCLIGDWNPESGRRDLLVLDEPIAESLPAAPARSILVTRLDGAIRALGTAAVADICVSKQARDLLLTLLAAQRRSLLSYKDRRPDNRGTHTLISARALLALGKNGDETAVFEHINAYADNSRLLDNLLRAISAAAEETPERAATARRIWPKIVPHVLELERSGHTPFRNGFDGDMALSSLIPTQTGELPFLYREVKVDPILWWDPLELGPEVEAWLELATGNPRCVDQLVGFIQVLDAQNQVKVGLPWIAKLVLAEPGRIAQGSFLLANWLIEVRIVVADSGLMGMWQQIVDALVVEGVTRLAPYSD